MEEQVNSLQRGGSEKDCLLLLCKVNERGHQVRTERKYVHGMLWENLWNEL